MAEVEDFGLPYQRTAGISIVDSGDDDLQGLIDTLRAGSTGLCLTAWSGSGHCHTHVLRT